MRDYGRVIRKLGVKPPPKGQKRPKPPKIKKKRESTQPPKLQRLNYTIVKEFNAFINPNKRCNKCEIEKPKSEFNPNIHNKTDGLDCACRECRNISHKVYREKHKKPKKIIDLVARKEREKQKSRERYRRKTDPTGEKRKRLYAPLKSKICTSCKKEKPVSEFYKDKGKRRQNYQSKCKECTIEYSRKYKSEFLTEEQKERKRAITRIWARNKRKTDIRYKLDSAMSTHIWATLKRNGGSKNGESWKKNVPYTVNELKRHLERHFHSGMTWDNYGPYWHVDHVIPKSYFKYKNMKDPEFQACWALSNLRPVLAKENMKKGNDIFYMFYKKDEK